MSSSSGRSRLLGRRARVALLAAVLVAAGLTAYRLVRVAGDSSSQKTRWRLHDQAVVLFDAGEYGEAARLYDQILAESPNDRTARFNRGLARLHDGLAEGWHDIERVAAEDLTFDEAHQKLAERALENGDTATAARELTLVVDIPPAPPAVRRALADLLFALGRHAEAMGHLERLARDVEATPATRAQAALDLARQHGRRRGFHRSPSGEMRREQEWYGTALRLADDALSRPDVAEREQLIAVRPFALFALDRPQEALAAAELALKAVTWDSTRASLTVLRAQMYWLAGNAELAETELQAALEGRPAAAMFGSVADVFEARGFRERALELVERGRQLHPEDGRLRTAHARTLFLAGRPDQAEEVLRDGAEWPESVDDLALLGDLRRARGDLPGARRAYERVLAVDPHRADVRLRLRAASAALSLTAGDVSETARRELEAEARDVLSIDPGSPNARLALARALLLSESADSETEEARSLLIEAVDSNPLLFEAQVLLAVAELRLGRHEEAVVGLERIIAALPTERPELRVLLSEAYLGLGDARRGLEEARRAHDVMGDDPLALRATIRAARVASQPDVALDALARLAVLEPDDVAHVIAQAFIHAEQGAVARAESRFDAADALAEGLSDEMTRGAALAQVAEARAMAYSRRGDQDAAREAFEGLVARLPRDLSARVRYGRYLQATGDRAEAERVFEAAIGLAPDAMEPRRALVDMWCAANEVTPELAAVVGRMRTLGGEDPDVLAAEGKLAALQGDLRLARERLAACVAARPGDVDAWYALGVVESRAGSLAAAIDALDEATGLSPRDPKIRAALARARFAHAEELVRYGRVREARAQLESAMSEDPNATAPREALVNVLFASGELGVGEAELRRLIEQEPEEPLLRRMLASLLAARGDVEAATHELLEAAARVPEDWTVWASLSAAYLQLGDVRRAEQAAGRSRDAAPTEPGSLSPLLQVLVDSGRPAEAASLVEGAISAHPDEGHYHVLRGMLHLLASEYREAVAACRRALERRPGTFEAAQHGSWALRVGLGDSDGAIAFLREAVNAAPEERRIIYLLGAILSQRGDYDQAMQVLEPITRGDPPSFDALSLVAMILMERRETAEARDVAERALQLNPESVDLHYLVAQTWLLDAQADGDPGVSGSRRSVVIERLERVLELMPGHHLARNNLAYLLSQEDSRLPEALEHAQKAADGDPDHVPYQDTLGVILMRLDRTDEAIRVLRGALAVIDREEARLRAEKDSPVFRAEPGRYQRLRMRLERQRAEVQQHYDQALGD